MHTVVPVPPAELIDFIASGDVAVIAAPDACLGYRYLLPNKLFEALFADLPLVVSDFDDMRDFVTQHGLGLVFTNGEVGAQSNRAPRRRRPSAASPAASIAKLPGTGTAATPAAL